MSRDQILRDPPKFHLWDGQWDAGGFTGDALKEMERMLKTLERPLSQLSAYETGAGLTTVWMLAFGLKVRSFFLEPELGDRIEGYIAEHRLPREKWTPHVGRSEFTLPAHVSTLEKEEADFAILDGWHSLQNAVIDFTGLNYALKPGGLLLIDDLQLAPCDLVRQTFTYDPGLYVEVSRYTKMAYLKKVTTQRILHDFNRQSVYLRPASDALASNEFIRRAAQAEAAKERRKPWRLPQPK